jgi:RNA polymerase nonessential primary-like sigma factor
MNIRFSTYLTNMLQKLSRLSTQYGSSIRVPENKQFKINRMNQIEQGLAEELGRAPTVAELSDSLGSTVKETDKLLQARKKDVNLSNLSFSPVFFESVDDDWVHFVCYWVRRQRKT